MYNVGGTPEGWGEVPQDWMGLFKLSVLWHLLQEAWITVICAWIWASDGLTLLVTSVLLLYLLILNLFQELNSTTKSKTAQVEIPALSLTSYLHSKFATLSMLIVHSTYKGTKQFFSGSYSLYVYLLSSLYPDYLWY